MSKPMSIIHFPRRRIDDALVARVMELWDCKRDTCDIAEILNETEADVAQALRLGREKRRQA